jgi:hypothetical protein
MTVATSMQRISSRTTLFFKRFFPWYLLGLVPLFLAVGFVLRTPFVVVPIFAGVIGFIITKQHSSQLVDEVWNAGDALIIRNKGQEDRIPLSAIMNVQLSWTGPPTVTLTLQTRGVFGDKVTFLAPVPFSSLPIINDLKDQIDDARKRVRA